MMTTPKYHFSPDPKLLEDCAASNKFTPEMFLPTRSKPKDTGYDVRCAVPEGLILIPGSYFLMSLGIRMLAPEGWWLDIRPRSGTFVKRHIQALYGVIDEEFEDVLMFAGKYEPDRSELLSSNGNKKIEFGEKVAQVIPVRRQDMEIINTPYQDLQQLYTARKGSRGESGFGDSGRF